MNYENSLGTLEQQQQNPALSRSIDLLKPRVAAICLAVWTVIWFSLAIQRPLNNPDEGRYAEIPREMLVSHDWVTPHINDVIYLEKPPLQYWATAIAYELFGTNEWSARLCTMLSAWLIVLCVYGFARKIWSRDAAVIAAAMLSSTLYWFVLGQTLTLDVTFTFWMTAALCAFCMAQRSRRSGTQTRSWMLATWALLAGAVLTKGIVALAIAGTVTLIYIVWHRDWRLIRRIEPFWGVLLFLLIVLPWFVMVSRANHGFLQFFFVHEHFQRFATDEAQRKQAWWYFTPVLAFGVLPWLPQMGKSIVFGWQRTSPRGSFDIHRFLWLWCVFIVIFFSVSQSKLAPYVFPVVPALALLTTARTVEAGKLRLVANAWTLGLFGASVLAFTLKAAVFLHDPAKLAVAQRAQPMLIVMSVVAIAGAIITLRVEPSSKLRAAFSLAIAWFICLSLVFISVARDGSLRSGKELVAAIAPHVTAHTAIFSVQTYDQTLPFYLNRTLRLVDVHGELEYGLQREPHKQLPDLSSFAQEWQHSADPIAVMEPSTYAYLESQALPMQIIATDRYHIAVVRP